MALPQTPCPSDSTSEQRRRRHMDQRRPRRSQQRRSLPKDRRQQKLRHCLPLRTQRKSPPPHRRHCCPSVADGGDHAAGASDPRGDGHLGAVENDAGGGATGGDRAESDHLHLENQTTPVGEAVEAGVVEYSTVHDADYDSGDHRRDDHHHHHPLPVADCAGPGSEKRAAVAAPRPTPPSATGTPRRSWRH